MNVRQDMRLHEQSMARIPAHETPVSFLRCRNEWRAEVAAALCVEANDNGFVRLKSAFLHRPASRERNKAATFAPAIARDEFGRFYWNSKLARQLAQALAAGPAGRRAGTSHPAKRGRQ